MTDLPIYTAFVVSQRLLAAPLTEVLTHLKARAVDPVLVPQDRTGRQANFDLSGTLEELLARAQPGPQLPVRSFLRAVRLTAPHGPQHPVQPCRLA